MTYVPTHPVTISKPNPKECQSPDLSHLTLALSSVSDLAEEIKKLSRQVISAVSPASYSMYDHGSMRFTCSASSNTLQLLAEGFQLVRIYVKVHSNELRALAGSP